MEQLYRKDISKLYDGLIQAVQGLSEVNMFSIYEVSHKNEVGGRAYIRSNDTIWKLWREIILPEISYLSILKIQKVDSDDKAVYFYFRVFFDYDSLAQVYPLSNIYVPRNNIVDSLSPESWKEEKKEIINRNTQKFREEVFSMMPQCPFTLITDERMLIASHIKPWNICVKQDAAKKEGMDPMNGLALSPSYDYLFDKGYLTFLDDGTLICGTRLGGMTWSRLNISPNKKVKLRILPQGRERYLNYHRQYVFKDSLNELI